MILYVSILNAWHYISGEITMPLMNIQSEWMSTFPLACVLTYIMFFPNPTIKFGSWVGCNKHANGNMLTIPNQGGLKFKCLLNLGRDTVWDTTLSKYRCVYVSKSVFILIIKPDPSSDSNSNLCLQVQYVSIISPVYTLKVLATNLSIWPSTSTTKNKRYSQQLINTVAIVKFVV